MCKEYVPALSLEKQLEKIESKNIIISDDKSAKGFLLNHSYYSIINGYKRHFLIPGEKDKMYDGTNFDHFVELYFLDTDLTEVIFKYILFVEKSVRTRLAYTIAMEISDSEREYLKRSLYMNTRGTRGSTLEQIERTIRNCKQDSVTYYFKHNKANIPPWIVVQDLSFATTIHWYDMLEDNLKSLITKDYFARSNLREDFQDTFFFYTLHFLREFRNKIAHGKIHFEEKTKHHLHLESSKHFFNYTLYDDETIASNQSGKDLYAAISIICGFLLDKKVAEKFITDLFNTFDKYIDIHTGNVTHTINDKTIYELFNLPENLFYRISDYYGTIRKYWDV
ncbi:Abi family protein [Hutsoniella sourekii]|uniref:Abi family protein n=1 Tax=Hutsoniella sourekii TaxID=87650 RepID=UPI000487A1F6|nr:Abi family protein [Hutsoniella sourekii]